MIVNCSSKNSLIRKKTKTALHIVPKTNEKYISVTYGCIRFIDSYRFLLSSLDSQVKTLVDNGYHKTLKTKKKKKLLGNIITKYC